MQQPGPATTPGVHISEMSIFPSTVAGVQTAVPAFIGYTETAQLGATPVPFTPVQIGSLADYEQTFGGGFRRRYALVPAAADGFDVQAVDPATGAPAFFRVEPVGNGFNLYDGMRLFFENGGGPCYVISTGTYADAEGATRPVAKAALLQGLAALAEQAGPTMLVMPDAVSLPPDDPAQPWISADFAAIAQAMLQQCATLQDRVAILDVYGTTALVPGGPSLDDVANAFHLAVGDAGLSYGMAYFPNLNTTVVDPSEIDCTWIADAPGAQPGLLARLLTAQNEALYGNPANPSVPTPWQEAVQAQIDAMGPTSDASLNASLVTALPLLAAIEALIVQRQNVLPPGPAMAGIITFVDGNEGVWTAPANVGMTAVLGATVPIDDAQQGALNVPVDGKAIDVLRDFPGRGTVVWGARTLDGNSNDYRYIQVRRTVIYIEQSIKAALGGFTFAPNDANTWTTVVAMVSSFLTQLWSQGGLAGGSPASAFRVLCGLGTTMTAQDILDGYMNVEVTVALTHPAEFIALTFQQPMQGAA